MGLAEVGSKREEGQPLARLPLAHDRLACRLSQLSSSIWMSPNTNLDGSNVNQRFISGASAPDGVAVDVG